MSNAVEILAARVKEAKETKEIVLTWKDMLAGNKAMKEAMETECKKLGFALSLLEKYSSVLPVAVVNYVAKIRENKTLYIKAEIDVKRTASGNITPFNLQRYIRDAVNGK